jgi:hypothetical protein
VNIAQQDRIAQREHTCPRCGAEPGKSCWEKARGNPHRKTYLARPHAERAELVQEEDGLARRVVWVVQWQHCRAGGSSGDANTAGA